MHVACRDSNTEGPVSQFDRDAFLRDGYAVIPQVFTREEAEEIRNRTIELVEELDREGKAAAVETDRGRRVGTRGDMLSYEPLRSVLLDPKLVGAVAEVLGGDPLFWGESGVWVGNSGSALAWHTDVYDAYVTQGAEGYPLVRCGLYFQDTSRHSDGLEVVAGSHVKGFGVNTLANRFRSMARRWLGARHTVLVEAEPGDLVIWDMRILHAGEAVRLKWAPKLALPLSWQAHLPQSLRVPSDRKRVVMFPTFGLPGPDLDRYLERDRSLDWMVEIWKASSFTDSVVEEAAAAGVKVIRPIPEYGSGAPAEVPA